jgi:phage-related protein
MFEWIGQAASNAWGWVSGGAASLWHKVVHLVHDVVHGVIGWLESLFHIVSGAWAWMLGAASTVEHAIAEAAEAVGGWIWAFVTHTLPSIWRKIEHAVQSAWHWVENAVKWAARHIAYLAKKAWHWVENAIKYVYHHFIRDIWRWIKHTGQHILHWAHTAWYLVTHPLKLAELLFWPLFAFFERVAWKIARKVGKWLAELVLQNLIKLVHLVEDIVAAVL